VSERHRWLRGEIERWVVDGLIDTAQGTALRDRYPVSDGVAWGRLILSGLGAILFGLGVILLFAYNWADMHKYAKLAVVFGALLIAHGTAMTAHGFERGRVASEGLHALGTMLFGAGIWLVAQIYHIDEHYPTALSIWALGALAMAWALPSVTQGFLAVALVLTWQGLEVFDFRDPTHEALWLILLGLFPLAWHLRSRALTGATASALLVSLVLATSMVSEELAGVVLLFAGGAYIAVARLAVALPGLRLQTSASDFSVLGQLGYLAVLYLLSFPELAEDLMGIRFDKPWMVAYFAGSVIAVLVLWVSVFIAGRRPAVRPWQLADLGSLAGLTLVLLLVLGGWTRGEWLLAAPFNLLFLVHAILLIVEGARRARLMQVVPGCLLFTLLVVSRYLDLFDSLIARGMAFLLMGGAIFVAGNLYARGKRRHLEAL